jgi:MFS family permease
LAVAAVIAGTGRYAPAFAMLAVPGVAVLGLLLWLRHRVPDPSLYEPGAVRLASRGNLRAHLSRQFWWYLAFTTATTTGYATFGVLSYSLVARHLVPAAAVPVVYAGAMAVDAAAALAAGWAFDRWGRVILVVVPLVTVLIPMLGFAASAVLALLGILLWGVITGIQESVMRAAVAGLVPASHRGSAYGVFAVGFGTASFVGGALTGALYDVSIPLLVAVVGTLQLVALGILVGSLRSREAIERRT